MRRNHTCAGSAPQPRQRCMSSGVHPVVFAQGRARGWKPARRTARGVRPRGDYDGSGHVARSGDGTASRAQWCIPSRVPAASAPPHRRCTFPRPEPAAWSGRVDDDRSSPLDGGGRAVRQRDRDVGCGGRVCRCRENAHDGRSGWVEVTSERAYPHDGSRAVCSESARNAKRGRNPKVPTPQRVLREAWARRPGASGSGDASCTGTEWQTAGRRCPPGYARWSASRWSGRRG
jgi:hypothetical protein